MNIGVHPAHPSSDLSEACDLAGVAVQPIDEHQLEKLEAFDTIGAVILEIGDEPLRMIRLGRRMSEDTGVPILLVAAPDQLPLVMEETFFADVVVTPLNPVELRLRVGRLAVANDPELLLHFEDLTINPATYQVTITDRPIDMTYMEYQLLAFFVENRGRVWSREQLLSKVWGYDYYGGARTVDVHVRRLRSKIGEERSHWITTVRSVGYRFG